MACPVVRFRQSDLPRWGVLVGQQIVPLELPPCTTGELITQHRDTVRSAYATHTNATDVSPESIPIDEAHLLSPVTSDARVYCQGANYRQHMIESGMDPDAKHFNMFFCKSSASISGPREPIIRPSHVRLLDYEIELGIVVGRANDASVTVSRDTLDDWVAGVTIVNDISARDVQIPQMQFFKGKSYRTFCPTGPVLMLLEKQEMALLDELLLELRVNGEVRQTDSTRNLVYKPHETLTELTQFVSLRPGDLVLTGTPHGCALRIPTSKLIKFIAALMSEGKRWEMFLESQLKRSEYLSIGDELELVIRSEDGQLHLGKQLMRVEAPA